MLRQWTALELAIHNAWGGSNSREKAQQLNTMIIEMFNKPEKVYKDELVMLLEDVLEVNFNVICEDGSIEEISELIILMWKQCGEADFTIAVTTLGREANRFEVISRSQGIDKGDAIDEDDNSDMEDNDNSINMTIDNAMDVEGSTTQVKKEKPQKVIDEDGFETVFRRGKR